MTNKNTNNIFIILTVINSVTLLILTYFTVFGITFSLLRKPTLDQFILNDKEIVLNNNLNVQSTTTDSSSIEINGLFALTSKSIGNNDYLVVNNNSDFDILNLIAPTINIDGNTNFNGLNQFNGEITLSGGLIINSTVGIASTDLTYINNPSRGVGGRAMVHDISNSLTFNFDGDFSVVNIGSSVNVDGSVNSASINVQQIFLVPINQVQNPPGQTLTCPFNSNPSIYYDVAYGLLLCVNGKSGPLTQGFT